MPYLDPYTGTLTKAKASHLLRRATFGPTHAEIDSFTGKTAIEAYNSLMAGNVANPSQPIILDETLPTFGQTFLNGPFDGEDNFERSQWIKFWWMAQFFGQTSGLNILEKLTFFWQNHFVTTREIVSDYRYIWRYLTMLRTNALGNFKTFVREVTLDPAMLVYLNGNENVKGNPNENYARELQELFVVGVKDFNGNPTYTENDVKEMARVLTGWNTRNYWWQGDGNINPYFDATEHDTGNKVFSNNYTINSITGQSGSSAGLNELNLLLDVLLSHPETPKYICRKLYKWYVNPIVTADIETNVIIPLAAFFKSTTNNWAIEPVLKKLLTSQIFYEEPNIGAIIKSPFELACGSARLFGLNVPNMTTDTVAFRRYFEYINWNTVGMQMNFMDQPSVFGYEPYYLASLSQAWIGTGSLALRNQYTDQYVWRWHEVKPGYLFGPNLVELIKGLQPNFLTPSNPNAVLSDNITTVQVLEALSKNLFVNDLFQGQKDFLIDTIMMLGIPRNSWLFEWQAFRLASSNPTTQNYTDRYNTVNWRLSLIFRQLLRMAEFHIF